MKMNNQERQALIDVAKKRLSQYRKMKEAQNTSVRPRGGIEIDYDVNIALMEVALAALTAEPVLYRWWFDGKPEQINIVQPGMVGALVRKPGMVVEGLIAVSR